MQNKLKKYTEERNKIAARMAALEERRKALDAKIMEAENLEIRAMMRSENLSLSELMELVRALQEKHRTPYAAMKENDDTAYENEEETNDEEL